MFVSSDASGEIYAIIKDQTSNGTVAGSGSSSSTGGKVSGSEKLRSSIDALTIAMAMICIIA